ncbi:tetratricopeptide repeat protein [Bremerella sp.]|uniref:tetratricopeptide repeat protein n=1 Tax=Bremerella sp. TaxID=2795602 RepID=UPI00391E03E2
MSQRLQRATMLIQMRRYDEAKRELTLSMADDPENPSNHMFMGLCHSELKENEQAIEHGELAVRMAPEWSKAHSMLSWIYMKAHKYKDARLGAEQALRLDPADTMASNVIAMVCADAKDWDGALRAAEMTLAHDPDDTEALNIRALALRSQGKAGASVEELKRSLQIDAEDATSHANLGWTYLQKGDLEKAETHFREALRLNPELDWARQGALETLKAKVPIYRWILGYFIWMATKTAGMQWVIIIGLYFGYKVIYLALAANPATQGLAYGFMALYLLFCVTTWFAGPISDAFLVLHPFGRLVLTPWERCGGLAVGAALFLTLAALVSEVVLQNEIGLVLAMCVGFPAIPMAMMFQSREGTPRNVMALVTVASFAMAIGFGVGAIYGLENLPTEIASFCRTCSQGFFFVPLGSIILANFLSMR